MKLGSKIRIIRVLKNISAKEMATLLNMSQGNYDKIEREEIDVSEENLAILAKELGVTVEFIKKFRKEYFFPSNNHQEENAQYNTQYLVNSPSDKMLALLEQTIQSMKEEIAYLREQNRILMSQMQEAE
jgi:transcriptional regulator with XRE-family HTH domain